MRLRVYCRLLLALTMAFFAVAVAAQSRVQPVLIFQDDSRYQYYQTLLRQALEVTQDTHSKASVQAYVSDDAELTDARGLYLLAQKRIDVVFLATSREREEKFRAIPIPLEKGLLGLRLFLIKESAQQRFDRIENDEQLRNQMRMGFNQHWADYEVYKANDFNLSPSGKYNTLFKMLASERFDYFPRGIIEVWSELERFKMQSAVLQIENRFAFFYDYPIYFFVNKDNEQLAKRLELGLKRLQTNGFFDAHFQSHFGNDIARAKLEQRHIIVLQNPQRPNNTHLIKPSWWPANTVFPDRIENINDQVPSNRFQGD